METVGRGMQRTPVRQRNRPPHLSNYTTGEQFDSQPLEERSHSQEPRPASEGGINLESGLPPLPLNSSHFLDAGLRSVLEKQDQHTVDRIQELLNRTGFQNLTVDDLAQSQQIQYKNGLDPGVETSTPVLGVLGTVPAFQASQTKELDPREIFPESLTTFQQTAGPKRLHFGMEGASGSSADPGDNWGLWENEEEIAKLFYKHAPDNFVVLFKLSSPIPIRKLAKQLRVNRPHHPDWPPISWIQ